MNSFDLTVCNGELCDKKHKCLRYEKYIEAMNSGVLRVWFLDSEECINRNYEFIRKII
jgi:hypothetical protein